MSWVIFFEFSLDGLQTLSCIKSACNSSRWGWFSIWFINSRIRMYSASSTVEWYRPWILKSRVPTSHASGFPVLALSHSTLSFVTYSVVFSWSNLTQFFKVTGLFVLANWSLGFGWIGWVLLLLLAAASIFQYFRQLSLRVTVGTGRGDRKVLVEDFLCLRWHQSFNTDWLESVIENDCVWPRLVKRQSLTPSKPYVNKVHGVLVYLPFLLVSSKSLLGQVELFFCSWRYTSIGFTAVKNTVCWNFFLPLSILNRW